MIKRIKFPLEMKKNFKVRNLNEFRENFDMEKAILYYKNGKLATWLEDRDYIDELEDIKLLDIADVNFQQNLCNIFKLEYLERLEVMPLEMKNNFVVRNLNEFRENFDIEKTIIYYMDGSLIRWLEYRYYVEELKNINLLNISNKNFIKNLCSIFKIKYTEQFDINPKKVLQDNQKIMELKKFTKDKTIFENIDNVAFTDREIDSLLKNNIDIIYLCGNSFEISALGMNVDYVGINKPIININAKDLYFFKSNNINFKNVSFNIRNSN